MNTAAEMEALATLRMHELLERSDVISINTPLPPQMDRFFDHDRIARMKRGSYLVNTARGRIVDTEAWSRRSSPGVSAGMRAMCGLPSRLP